MAVALTLASAFHSVVHSDATTEQWVTGEYVPVTFSAYLLTIESLEARRLKPEKAAA